MPQSCSSKILGKGTKETLKKVILLDFHKAKFSNGCKWKACILFDEPL